MVKLNFKFNCMKKLNYILKILIILLPLSLISCKKDKEMDETIIGKWEVISLKQATFENNIRKTEIIVYYGINEMAYQFVEGGSGIYFENDEEFLFSWSLNGNTITRSTAGGR